MSSNIDFVRFCTLVFNTSNESSTCIVTVVKHYTEYKRKKGKKNIRCTLSLKGQRKVTTSNFIG